MAKLNKTDFQLKLKRGLRASLEGDVAHQFAAQGEPHYTTDGEQLFIYNGTMMKPVQSLDMAVTHDDAVVVHNDSIVYMF